MTRWTKEGRLELVRSNIAKGNDIGQEAFLLGLVDELTAERDDARRLALPAFTSPEGDLSEHTHVLEREATDDEEIYAYPPDRPDARDMPVGSVVVTAESTYKRWNTHDAAGWAREPNMTHVPPLLGHASSIQSGWIEGLFSDGLVTEWRLP